MIRIWVHKIILVTVVLSGIGLIATWWAIRQTQQVPEFYRAAAEQVPEQTARASRQMQANVRQLRSDAAKIGSWRAVFDDDVINAWLSEELPSKFPRLLRCGASEPRIVIQADRVMAAIKYRNKHIDTIISCELKVELTEQPNVLALRIESLRAGALPLPLSKFLTGISKEAARGGVDIQWDMTQAGPIALVTVPSEDPRYAIRPVIVESVKLVDGQMKLSGHTGEMAHHAFRPDGPIHQFVSYRPTENRSRQPQRLSSRRESSTSSVR